MSRLKKLFEIIVLHQDANNAAYTSEFLGLHVDLPYYNYGPGVNITIEIMQHVYISLRLEIFYEI